MPRYFFDIVFGPDIIADHDGVNLADAEAAQRYALQEIRELFTERRPSCSMYPIASCTCSTPIVSFYSGFPATTLIGGSGV